MSKKKENKHQTPNIIGKCKCCNEDIYENRLYVDSEEGLYFYSCYNRKVRAERNR